MRVGELMTRGVVLVAATATVREAATTMAEHDIGAVLVGTEERLEGILTDRDIIFRVVVDGRDPGRVRAGEVRSPTLHACGPDDSVEAALDQMAERQVRRLPVLDGAGRLVGIVTRRDLARAALAAARSAVAAAEVGPAGLPAGLARRGGLLPEEAAEAAEARHS